MTDTGQSTSIQSKTSEKLSETDRKFRNNPSNSHYEKVLDGYDTAYEKQLRSIP